MTSREIQHRICAPATTPLLIALVVASCTTAMPTHTPEGVGVCDIQSAAGVCFHVIGHRGAAGYAPENTLPSVRKAVELGAIEVEIDVQLSRDGVLMLYHDSTLDQKTDLSGSVREHTASELGNTDIGYWFDQSHPSVGERYAGTQINRFEELLEEFGDRIYYHVELKSLEPELPRLVIEALEGRDLIGHATITSFDFAQLERARHAAPKSPICWLLRSQLPPEARHGQGLLAEQRKQVDRAAAAGFQMVGVRSEQLNHGILAYARAQQLGIRAFGIKSDVDMDHAIELGADGMTIDWPDKLLARVTARKSAE
jgi:glycerophosphoryl diester phosphodiesterase